MSKFQHPAFPDVTFRCADDMDDDAAAKGWIPFLDAEQTKRLAEIEGEVESRAAIAALERGLAPHQASTACGEE